MLVKTTVHEVKQIEKNIELPYYSKKSNEDFFRINEDESVLKVSLMADFSYQMSLNLKTSFGKAHGLDQAIAAQPCSAEEVEGAVKKYFQLVGGAVEMLAESTNY